MLKLALSTALGVGAFAQQVPKGVPPQLAQAYSGATFTCDVSKSIPIAKVNDDYCDCKDGTDEPGTSACSYQFTCENVGFKPKTVPSSLVCDGVCDCCDGADESNCGTPSKCTNTCEVDGQEYRKQVAMQKAFVEQGSKIRQQYVQEAAATDAAARKSVETITQALEAARIAREQAEEVRYRLISSYWICVYMSSRLCSPIRNGYCSNLRLRRQRKRGCPAS
jgi:protein kinase C substrate 80K-H